MCKYEFLAQTIKTTIEIVQAWNDLLMDLISTFEIGVIAKYLGTFYL